MSENDSISCITVDSGIQIVRNCLHSLRINGVQIMAAMKSRIASWALSGVDRDSWRVHSCLFLPADQSVSCLDSKSGTYRMASFGCHLIQYRSLGCWNRKQVNGVYADTRERPANLVTEMVDIVCALCHELSDTNVVRLQVPPVLLRFSHSLMYIATTSKVLLCPQFVNFSDSNQTDKVVRLYSTASGRQTQAIPHPRPITNVSWRYCQASSRLASYSRCLTRLIKVEMISSFTP